MSVDKIDQSFLELKRYCENCSFKGYDPYDGLNSKLFCAIPFASKSRFIRLVWIQFFKRSPINLRKLVGIKHEYNPKALGLFLSAYCILYKQNKKEVDFEHIHFFIEKIEQYKSKGYSGDCWGYNFDWESRAFFQPKFTPTIVASTFIANALLDAYEITKNEKLLQSARSTCTFILKDLNRTVENENSFAFSYSPIDKSVVYNASLLGARLLARVYFFTKEKILSESAKSVMNYCCNCQKEDGSWSYGALPFHQWIDNFHTGYNLECIADYMKFTDDYSYTTRLSLGFDYYIKTFFTESGIAKYYNNSVFPVDIHAPSQLVMTLEKLDKISEHKVLLDKVLNRTIDKMQSKNGYFYYQINKYITSKIPYMRWSQAWMFLSLTVYRSYLENKSKESTNTN